MRSLNPSQAFTAILQGAPPGIAAALGVKAIDIDTGETVVARIPPGAGNGVVEQDPPSGHYRRPGLAGPATVVTFQVVWDHNGLEIPDPELYAVTFTRPDAPAHAGPTYAAPADLRAELGLDAAALPDETADRLIADAEDLIDSWIPSHARDATTGRRVTQENVGAHAWSRINRATIKLAAHLHRDPHIIGGPRYGSTSGPRFSQSDYRGLQATIPDVVAAIRASGLLAGTARARP